MMNAKSSRYDYDVFMLKNEVITYEVQEELICQKFVMRKVFICSCKEVMPCVFFSMNSPDKEWISMMLYDECYA